MFPVKSFYKRSSLKNHVRLGVQSRLRLPKKICRNTHFWSIVKDQPLFSSVNSVLGFLEIFYI